jgi:HEAT repeat protein
MLFHEPQSGHFPSHFGDWLPHFWQLKTVFCFTGAPCVIQRQNSKGYWFDKAVILYNSTFCNHFVQGMTMDFYRPPALQGAMDALGSIYRALRAWKFYPQSHPTRKSSVRQAHTAMLDMLDGQDLHLNSGRTGFSLPDGEELKDDSHLPASLSYELFIRRVQKITFLRDIYQEDLLAFIRILTLSPDAIYKGGGMDKLMSERGIRTIWCNEFDLSIIRNRRSRVESTGTIPQGVDTIEDGTDDNIAFPDQPNAPVDPQDPGRELLGVLGKLATSMDADIYLLLVRQAIACSDILKARHEFEALLPLVELLSEHAGDTSREKGLLECSRFGLEQLAMGEEFLSYMFDRMGTRAGLSSKAMLGILAVAGPAAVSMTVEKMAATDNLTVRKALSTQLIKLGEPVVPVILRMLDDKRWFIVRNLSAILGDIGAASAVPELMNCLRHSDIRVCKEAVRSLAKIGGKDAEDAILAVLVGNDPALIPQAISSLGGMKSRKALVELMRIVCRYDMFLNNLPLKVEALSAIAMIGDRQVVPILTELLASRHLIANSRWEQLKIAIAASLARLGDTRALPVLKKKSLGSGELGRACAEAAETIERTGGYQHGST